MMEQYQLFDELLMKSKAIRAFWLNSVGAEIDEVASFIERLSADRERHLTLKG